MFDAPIFADLRSPRPAAAKTGNAGRWDRRRSYALDMSGERSARDFKDRVARAKAREIEAHRRASKLHEDALILFERLHQTAKARDARQRAERAQSDAGAGSS
jgi:hypothetical protein